MPIISGVRERKHQYRIKASLDDRQFAGSVSLLSDMRMYGEIACGSERLIVNGTPLFSHETALWSVTLHKPAGKTAGKAVYKGALNTLEKKFSRATRFNPMRFAGNLQKILELQ